MKIFIHSHHDLLLILCIEDGEIDFSILHIRRHDGPGDSDHGFVKDIGAFFHQHKAECTS